MALPASHRRIQPPRLDTWSERCGLTSLERRDRGDYQRRMDDKLNKHQSPEPGRLALAMGTRKQRVAALSERKDVAQQGRAASVQGWEDLGVDEERDDEMEREKDEEKGVQAGARPHDVLLLARDGETRRCALTVTHLGAPTTQPAGRQASRRGTAMAEASTSSTPTAAPELVSLSVRPLPLSSARKVTHIGIQEIDDPVKKAQARRLNALVHRSGFYANFIAEQVRAPPPRAESFRG